MSNTRRIKPQQPPDNVRALADAYECGHCTADKALSFDGAIWHLNVAHDATCPVLLGRVNRAPQLAEALAKVTSR